uniref:Disease resistance protein RGA3 n=1 Tax=Ananas comosus var. bracteatus TaxID=296719 RepID=A0A6V7QD22_ANACO|nr:unnamed protein product [Ananas comosus var. bracteatus]
MGWLLSFAKEVVQSAAASVAADELVRLLPSLDHDLEVLRTTLLTTRLRVDKAEQWRFKNPHFDQLLMQLKAAFYDAEDLIAEFDYVELQQKIEGGQASLLLSSSLDFVKNLISRAPDKVRQYQRRLDDAAAALEKVIVDLNFCDEPKRSDVLRRRQTGSFVTEQEVFGRDEEREKVIALLLRPGDESGRTSNSESVPAKRMKRDNVSVLPIVGIGGMGKTTLAQVVFNDPRIRHYFETRIWICVSEIFDVKRLTKEVINNVDLSHQTDGKNSSWSERFLLVLDDVWNEDRMEWDKFYALMRNGYWGSMILTTTRSSKVADIMGTMDSIFLEGLPDDSFREFFKICAFGYGNEKVDQELESIAKKIATKLKGTPLAAKTVGGLLKEKMDAKHWSSIMNSEMWKLRQGENDIFPALQLSYQYLPPHLKRCFAICSIFPKDHEIDKVSLIELWLAQGFVTSEDNMLPEDVATSSLELLVLENVGWESLPKLWDEGSPVEGRSSRSIKSSSLSYLSIKSCSNLTSLYEWLLPLYLPALKSINIVDCTKLTALQIERFKDFLSLERLEIKNCPKLASQEEMFFPSSLLSLHISSCGDLDKSFPSCLQNLTSLTDLDLFNCQHTESLPRKFLGNLTSLKLLHIVNCPELRSLGGSGALTSLQELTILDCPRLTETEPLMYVNRVCRKDDTVPLVVVIDNTALLQLPFFRNLLPSTMSLKIQNSLESLIFVEDSNKWLQILASVRYLSFEHCSNLRSLPAWLCGSTSLQLRITDCPKIDLLPSLPAAL